MGSIHRTIEGACPTASTWQPLLTLGPETINYIDVPEGYGCVKRIFVTAVVSTMTDAKGWLGAIRLHGDGMPNQPFEFFVCGGTHGTKTTSGGVVVHMRPFVLEANLAVKPGSQIEVDGNQITGSDAGTVEYAVELEFVRGGGKKRYSYVRWVNSMAAADTEYEMTLDGKAAAVNQFKVPADCSRITSVTTVIGGICLATASGGAGVVRLEGGMPDGGQSFACAGGSSLNTTPGLNAGIYETEEEVCAIQCTPKALIHAYGEQLGVDHGTPYAGVSVIFE